MTAQFFIDTIPGFDGGAPFQFGKPEPDFAAGTDPAAWLTRLADQIAAREPVDAAFAEPFLRALANRIHLAPAHDANQE